MKYLIDLSWRLYILSSFNILKFVVVLPSMSFCTHLVSFTIKEYIFNSLKQIVTCTLLPFESFPRFFPLISQAKKRRKCFLNSSSFWCWKMTYFSMYISIQCITIHVFILLCYLFLMLSCLKFYFPFLSFDKVLLLTKNNKI